MNDLISKFLTQVVKQGFSIVLLVAITFYFQWQNGKLDERINACTDAQLEFLKKDRSDFLKVMMEVKVVLEANNRLIRKVNKEDED